MKLPPCIFLALLALVLPLRAEVEWQPAADMDGQLFSSLILATATMKPDPKVKRDPKLLGDQTGLLGIAIKNAPANSLVKISVRENALMEACTFTIKIPATDREYSIAPKISYKFDKMRHVFQQRPLNVAFAVELDGQPLGEQMETVNVHSIDDCPYGVADSEDALPNAPKKSTKTATKKKSTNDRGYVDMSWMFAAYVNESHPLIDTILKEALATKIVTAFDGYQAGSRTKVVRQAFAIWRALQDHGIRYSNTTATPGGSRLVLSQHVRFLEDALGSAQANCVDGSALFASILRKLEMDPFLVLVPGHMYVGVYLDDDEDSNAAIAIDTTTLGEDVKPAEAKLIKELRGLDQKLGAAQRGAAWKSFKAATAEATEDFRRHKHRFDSGNDPQYQIVDIGTARDQGVMPIAYEKAMP